MLITQDGGFTICIIFILSLYQRWKCMKVKSDHRSEFSNFSNWKEEA